MPKLRFKREDGTDYPEWEDWVLDSIGSFYGGLSGKTKEDFGKGNSKFVTYMNVYKNIFAMQEMLESVDISDNEKQNKVKYGDLLMTQSSETVEELGMSSVYLFYDEPYLNSFCFGLHLYNHALTYPMYIGYLMRSEAIRKQIMREGQGISRINLSPNRMKGMILSLPCLEEQQKIADFLSNVDEVIAQSEAEVANLQQQKKAAMQKIFSQEVRFKREDGTSYPEWEEKKLGSVCDNIGDGLHKAPSYDESGDYYFINGNNLKNGKIVIEKQTPKVSVGTLQKSDKSLDTATILMSINGTIGNLAFYQDEKIMLGKSVAYLKVSKNVCKKYIYSVLQTRKVTDNFKLSVTGTTIKNLGLTAIRDTPIFIPCLEEQQKIADFLATYDEAISCAKQELDKWKELKKGLLQQMFA